jgi:CIC family chloride channel protein
MALKRRGIAVNRESDIDVLDSIAVGEVMMEQRGVTAETALSTLTELFDSTRSHGVAVVEDGRLVGVVTITDLVRSRTDGAGTVADIMTRNPVTVTNAAPVSMALERMAALGVGRLPVVADDDPQRFMGLFKRESVVRAYQLALSRSTDHAAARQRLRIRSHPGAEFFDVVVPAGSTADGRLIREISWPSGCTVVAIRTGNEVQVPSGDTALRAGDHLTIYGTDTGRRRMMERLGIGDDD